MSELLLSDIYNIKPDERFKDLTDDQKAKVTDKIMQQSSKGLMLDLVMSSGARKINGRIYSPKGQVDGLESWTKPYERAFVNHHNTDQAIPWGRIKSASIEQNDSIARSFFSSNISFNKFKDIAYSSNFKAIYNSLKDNNLLHNEKWPGIHDLVGTVLITDETAIKRFLDGTLITFSSGHKTDSFVCTECFTDWMTDGFCDHKMGTRGEDGKQVSYMVGKFIGRELSYVNMPANDRSVLRSMHMLDSWSEHVVDTAFLELDKTSVYFTDSHINIGDIDIMAVSKVENDTPTPVLPQVDIDKLALLVADKLKPTEPIEDIDNEDVWKDVEITDELAKELAFLDDELDKQMGDARLSSVDRKKLKSDTFCGPNRSFPVPDCEHVSAGMRLIGRADISDSTRSKIRKCLVRKNKTLSCKIGEDSVNDILILDLQKDYIASLKRIDELQNKIINLEQKVQVLDRSTLSDNNDSAGDNKPKVTMPPTVENPSVSGENNSTSDKSLTDYETLIVSNYSKLAKDGNIQAANDMINRKKQKGILPRNFDITKYFQENE